MTKLALGDMIVTDNKILRQVSVDATVDEVERINLVSRLKEANKIAWTAGAGLAAIQIGVPLRVAWYTHKGREHVLFNPIIENKWGVDTKEEGCLSIPCMWVRVSRAWTVEVINTGKRRKGRRTVSGFEARLIQHEIDHMNGILITDKRDERTI